MLTPIEQFIGMPIMSLQTGAQLATTSDQIVIDPRQLTVAAFYVEGPTVTHSPSVLHPADIREISGLGLIVDNESKLMPLDDLPRLQETISHHFSLIGMKVVDQNKRNLGKVSGYSIETKAFSIQQLYTEQPLLRSFKTASNVIRRSQIIAVESKRIVVESPTVKTPAVSQTERSANPMLANPFRGGSTAQES